MKKDKRLIYLNLTGSIGVGLCVFCKYGVCEGGGYSICEGVDGYYVCNHPIEELSYMDKHEMELEPMDDCYGFRPQQPLKTIVEIISTILIFGYEQWQFSIYGKHGFTLVGEIPTDVYPIYLKHRLEGVNVG